MTAREAWHPHDVASAAASALDDVHLRAAGDWSWWPDMGTVTWRPGGGAVLFPLDGDVRFDQWLQCVQPLDRRMLLHRLLQARLAAPAVTLRFRAVDGHGRERWVAGEARCDLTPDGLARVSARLAQDGEGGMAAFP